MLKECVLESGKSCSGCGQCNRCDLDEDKICDNCCRCLGEADYAGVQITEIIIPKEIKMRWKRQKDSKGCKTCKH